MGAAQIAVGGVVGEAANGMTAAKTVLGTIAQGVTVGSGAAAAVSTTGQILQVATGQRKEISLLEIAQDTTVGGAVGGATALAPAIGGALRSRLQRIGEDIAGDIPGGAVVVTSG